MRQNHFHAAARVDVPVALGFGELDRLIRPARTEIPGAEIVVLRGCGHIPMWDDPAQVVALVQRTAGRERVRSWLPPRFASARVSVPR